MSNYTISTIHHEGLKDYILNDIYKHGKNSTYWGTDKYHLRCMDSWWKFMDRKDQCFHFAILQPIWFEDIVKEFNALFKNIKIIVMEKRKLSVDKVIDSYDGNYLGEGNTPIYLVRFKIVIDYRYKYKKSMLYITHHILQYMSPAFDYVDLKSKKLNLSELVKLTKKFGGYDYYVLCPFGIGLDLVLKMDNIEYTNSALDLVGKYRIKQNDFFTHLRDKDKIIEEREQERKELLKEEFEENFNYFLNKGITINNKLPKVGDIVVGSLRAYYNITNRYSILKVFGKRANSIDVEILYTEDEEYKGYIGRTYTVQTQYFYVVENSEEVLERIN
jgi:hypothetical protein